MLRAPCRAHCTLYPPSPPLKQNHLALHHPIPQQTSAPPDPPSPSPPPTHTQSFLIEISAIIANKKDEVAGGFLVDKIVDKTGAKGTGVCVSVCVRARACVCVC